MTSVSCLSIKLAAGGVEAVIADRMEILLADGHEVIALFLKDRGGLSLFQPFMDHVGYSMILNQPFNIYRNCSPIGCSILILQTWFLE